MSFFVGRRRSSTEALHPDAAALERDTTLALVHRLHRADQAAFAAVGRALPSIARAVDAVTTALGAGGRLIYVGAGTSGRLGVLDAVECPPTFGTRPSQVQALLAGGRRAITHAVEGAEDDAAEGRRQIDALLVGAHDVVCGITAGGHTPFVLGALAAARARRATTVLLTCNPTAVAPRALRIVLPTGPELVAGSTRLKAGTATKLVLNTLSTAAMVRLGRVYRGRMVGVRASNAKLRARAAAMVEELSGLPRASARTLLGRAGGEPAVALAMHWTGLDARRARAALRKRPLRALAPRSRR